MVLSYITTILYTNHLVQQEGADIDEELMLPTPMSESPPSASASTPKHHIISIIDFMRHTRHTLHPHEHRITIPATLRL